MFITKQPEEQQKKYITLLQAVGGLSGLFSDNDSPYLYYRAAERVFCKAFEAEDLSREDCSYDAKKSGLGIGLKTFLYKNGSCLEKVAEFNSISDELRAIQNDPEKLIRKVASSRNKRLNVTNASHGLESGVYHCVARDNQNFSLYECPISNIDIPKISYNKDSFTKNTLVFNDDKNEYRFSLSKSTLFKRFQVKEGILQNIPIEILDDPFELIQTLFRNEEKHAPEINQEIILPLYSERDNNVPTRSGLNQWNAKSRARDKDEVYIQIPKWIHEKFPNFFPEKDEEFDLELPDGNILSVRHCQGGGTVNGKEVGKALMSSPNKDLGHWILRVVLKLQPEELCTLDMLKEAGIDSVSVTKIDAEKYRLNKPKYKINFTSWNTYSNFKDNHLFYD